jgi:protein-tyrosine phosphatase
LQQGGHLLGEALRILSDQDNGPVVFHCAAGKDRTGLLAALLLSGLGVPDEIVYADYAMSELAGEKTREWAKVVSPEFAERFATMPPVLMSAHPDSIKGLLADIRESHGTIRNYCLTIGVEAHHWDALEDHLLETL